MAEQFAVLRRSAGEDCPEEDASYCKLERVAQERYPLLRNCRARYTRLILGVKIYFGNFATSPNSNKVTTA